MTRSYSSITESNNSSSNNVHSQENAILRQMGKSNQQQFKSTTLPTGLSSQQPIAEMPKALDYRNFMEFPRLQDDIRIKLYTSLKYDERDEKRRKRERTGDVLSRFWPLCKT